MAVNKISLPVAPLQGLIRLMVDSTWGVAPGYYLLPLWGKEKKFL